MTLETIKESDWDQQIEGNEFAAHYRVTTDPATGERRFVNFGAGVEGTDANVKFYEFNEQGERVAFSEVTLPGAACARGVSLTLTLTLTLTLALTLTLTQAFGTLWNPSHRLTLGHNVFNERAR